MKVNFNNLRKQAVLQANGLSKQLTKAKFNLYKPKFDKPNDVRHGNEMTLKAMY